MFLLRRAALQGTRSASFASRSTRSFSTTKLLVARQLNLHLNGGGQRRLYSEETDKESADSGLSETSEPGDSATESSVVETARNALGNATRAASEAVSSVVNNGQAFGPSSNGAASPSKILYIGNLNFDLGVDTLRSEFARIGNVVNCRIVTDASGLSKGFGYVEFDSMEEAAKAVEQLHDQELGGRKMNVQYHIPRLTRSHNAGTTNNPSSTLFVGNMSFQMTDKDINDLFRQLKDVLDVRVAIDRRTGQPRGFAHADFTSVAAAEKAKKVLESQVIYGRKLRIDYGVSSRAAREARG